MSNFLTKVFFFPFIIIAATCFASHIPIPPSQLIYRVAGHEDAGAFLHSGKDSLKDFEEALASVGAQFTDFEKILEWGCGCGRIMRHMRKIKKHAKLYGCDIDQEAISWAKANIPFASFSICQGLPPTQYPDNYFDLILNHSVLTHLDETYQDPWLAELKRILKPGGTIILSVHGDSVISTWLNDLKIKGIDTQKYADTLDRKGILFFKDDQWGGIFPDYYHSTFHRTWYVKQHWGKFFKIKSYLERRGLNFQDYVVMVKE